MSTYTTSTGDELNPMSYAEALEIVHDLAEQNQIEDEELAVQAEWQQKALDTLHDLVVNHEDTLESFTPTKSATDWESSVIQPDREDDPEQPFNAIRIALSLAEGNALRSEQAVGAPELQDEVARQRQALDLVADLLGRHTDELKRITLINTSRLDP